jgi:hypothetical protein
MLGLERDVLTGEWRRLHIEELYNLCSSPYIIWLIKSRRKKLPGHVAGMGDRRGAYRVLVGKPKGKRPLGRPRHRWEDNIRISLQKWNEEAWACTRLIWVQVATGGRSL